MPYLEQEDRVLVFNHSVREFWLGRCERIECHEEIFAGVLQPGLQSVHVVSQAQVVADITGLLGLHQHVPTAPGLQITLVFDVNVVPVVLTFLRTGIRDGSLCK